MKNVVFSLICGAIFYACATPGTPQGGIKDEITPKPIAYNPSNQTVNFTGKQISIAFDENVNITNPQNEVIISPPAEPFPSIIAKRDEVIIKFKEELRPNTTYQIAFGNSIKDVNEANPADNVQLVFSTGPSLDSMSIEGKIISAYGDKLPANTFVQLYSDFSDSAVIKSKPLYIYKVGSDGTFKFNYLPRDSFKLVAISDLNSNYLYDLPTESIGVFPAAIVLDSNAKDISVSVYLPEETTYKYKDFSTQLDNGLFAFKLNKTLFPPKDSISVYLDRPNAKSVVLQNLFSTDKQTIFISSDSFPVNCVVYINDIALDTVRLRANKNQPTPSKIYPNEQAVLTGKSIYQHPNNAPKFSFKIPVSYIDTPKISLTDTLLQSIDFQINYDDQYWNANLQTQLVSGKPYILTFEEGAISFINGTKSTADTFNIIVQELKKHGVLDVTVSFPKKENYLIALRTKDGRYRKELFVNADLWSYDSGPLEAGSYVIEVIEDLNADGRWNSGNYWLKQTPERVFRSQEIVIKENWDQKISVVVNFKENLKPLPFFENKEDSKENKGKANNIVPR